MIEMLIQFPSDIVKKKKKKKPNEKQFFFPRVWKCIVYFWKPLAAPRCAALGTFYTLKRTFCSHSAHFLSPRGRLYLMTLCLVTEPASSGQFVTSDFRGLPCQGCSDTVAEQDTGQVVVVFFVLLSLFSNFSKWVSFKMSLIAWKRPSAWWMRHLNSTGYLHLVSVSVSERLRDNCGDKLMM